MPATSPIAFTADQLAAVTFNEDGLVAAIVQEEGTGEVLMLAWMNQESLRRSLESGRTWFWSRSRQEYWCKGETSGDRQYIRRAFYDCDGDTLLFVVEQEGAGACHTGNRSCFYRAFGPESCDRARGDMVNPGRAEFHDLAASYRVVPVWRDLLADLITPVAAFARLCRGDQPGFLLESVEHGERWSRWSFVGRNPRATLTSRQGRLEVSGDLPADLRTDEGVLAAVDDLLAAYRSPSLPDLAPLHGGLIGYLGYDVVREVERLPDVPFDDRGSPDVVLSVIGELAAFDHWRQRVTLIANVIVPPDADGAELDALYDDAVARLDQLALDGASPLSEPLVEPPAADDELPVVTSPTSAGDYCRAVEVAKEHIVAGDIFQVVLSQRFDFELGADPFDAYRVLRQVNPSPYMYFVRLPELTLIGCSPEPMVQLLDGRVISRPIAGTRRRGRTDEEDRRMGAELSEHPKELAEHVMLVDLARNDVGRVVRFGTEQVDEMMTLERYSHVMHLTSQVSGELADGLGPIDVLAATLPAGTVSGSPKVRAMEIIDALEPVKRGPYAGVVGYLDFSGNIDTAIAIRTMVVWPDGRASVQAGAGVVADSVPEEEDLECHNKARALLSAVPGARRMTAQRRATIP